MITVRKRSCEKVMFSQACVNNSVQKGGVSASVHAGIHPHLGRPPQKHTPWKHTSLEAYTPLEVQPPSPTFTAADCTHPTGILSCYMVYSQLQLSSSSKRRTSKWSCVEMLSSPIAPLAIEMHGVGVGLEDSD